MQYRRFGRTEFQVPAIALGGRRLAEVERVWQSHPAFTA